MNDRPVFLNQAQPQTLVIGTLLLYINAFFGILGAFGGGQWALVILAIGVGQAIGGFGIANEKRWGYNAAIGASVAAVAFIVFLVMAYGSFSDFFSLNILISLIFDVALVALLVHPQSRDYTKIWFK